MNTIDAIPIVAKIPNTEHIADEDERWAIFLDGDSTNTDPDNVLGVGHFEAGYTYMDYLDDFEDRIYFMERVAQLEEALQEIQGVVARLTRLAAETDRRKHVD